MVNNVVSETTRTNQESSRKLNQGVLVSTIDVDDENQRINPIEYQRASQPDFDDQNFQSQLIEPSASPEQ